VRLLIIGLIACCNVLAPAFAAGSACHPTQLAKKFDLWPPLGYVVAGTGRLYFHTEPSSTCIQKDIFVVPGDSLTSRADSGDWSKVEYLARNGEYYEGWVVSNRLAFTGTVGNTDEKDFAFYDKAAKDAKAGKLGSPWQSK